MSDSTDLEIELKTESSKAVITGKTAVPFRTFVGLVLQRKVFQLFKQWDKEPVILSSELLTQLASAPQDSQENKAHLVLVTLGVGICGGIFLLAFVEVALSIGNIRLDQQAHALIAGSLAGIAILLMLLAKIQRLGRGQKIADSMERVAGFLSKK